MVLLASATAKRYEEKKKNPLFFCKIDKKIIYVSGKPFTQTIWISCDSTIDFSFEIENYGLLIERRELFFMGKQTNKADSKEGCKIEEDIISFEVTPFDISAPDHWLLIFKECQYNFDAGNFRHCIMSLIWALNSKEWDIDILKSAFQKCSISTQQIVANSLKNYLFIFSLNKQKSIISLINNIIPNLQPLLISNVESALAEMYPEQSFASFDFYKKVDLIIKFGEDEYQKDILRKLYSTSRNSFIHYKYWKETEYHKLFNYEFLLEIYSYVSAEEQMLIIKRYLHDVRINVINFDDNIITGFKNYKYPNCVDGRYFIASPGSDMLLGGPLFSDSILTLKETNGERLQTYNGLLDLAVSHNNKSYPGIDFEVNKLLPCCDGGLIPNTSFIGFIHYVFHYSLDESLLTEENLTKMAEYILQNYASHQTYWCCANDNERILSDKERTKCQRLYSKHINNSSSNGVFMENVKCNGLIEKNYSPERWKRKDSESDKILSLCIENLSCIDGAFTFGNVSLARLEMVIRRWASTHKDIILHNDCLPDEFNKNKLAKYVIDSFYRPTIIDIYPYTDVFFSSKKSLLNTWNEYEIINNTNEEERDKYAQLHEKEQVFIRVFETLNKLCPNGVTHTNHITIPYNQKELSMLSSAFYYRKHIYNPTLEHKYIPLKNLKFLVSKSNNYKRYCTPKLSGKNEDVSGLPFFWCGSKACFCNVLGNQTLEKERDWRQYTLFHAAEILGYKLIVENPEGNTVKEEIISNFSAELRQAERLLSRLICRSCGHMIFSKFGSMLNGSRHFLCLNKQCEQHDVLIYLSQCNHCKSGLIDSRESDFCPNNWVICPYCLACCNDDLFQNLYDRHSRNGYIPRHIKDNLGKGHNNKKEFFCPICGRPLVFRTIKGTTNKNGQQVESTKEIGECINCKKSYQEQLDNYNKSV